MIRKKGESLVDVANIALEDKGLEAEFVMAEECGVMAETKDHQKWESREDAVAHMGTPEHQVVEVAYKEVEDQEDEHLFPYHGVEPRGLDRSPRFVRGTSP